MVDALGIGGGNVAMVLTQARLQLQSALSGCVRSLLVSPRRGLLSARDCLQDEQPPVTSLHLATYHAVLGVLPLPQEMAKSFAGQKSDLHVSHYYQLNYLCTCPSAGDGQELCGAKERAGEVHGLHGGHRVRHVRLLLFEILQYHKVTS